MNQKGFAPIIVIIIIISLIGGGLLISKKVQLPITNYQTKPQVNGSPSATDSAKPAQSSIPSLKPTKAANQPKSPPALTPAPVNKPVKIGSIKGKVVGGYYSRGLSNATVKAKGEIEKTVTTESSGDFTVANLPVGKYTLSFSHPDYTNFREWKDFEVKEGDNYLNRTPNGFLKVFKSTTIKGTVFIDRNDNKQKDAEDTGLDASFELYNELGDDSWHLYQNISADSSGNFSLEIKDGSTYKLVPLHHTSYRLPPSVEFVVDGYGETKEFSLPYYPTLSQASFTIEVFNDKNENSNPDADEENIDYYYAEVTNTTTGNSYKTSVSAQSGLGKGNIPMEYGVYKIKLVPGNDSWAYYYKITKAEGSVTITSASGDQTVKLGVHKL